MARLADRATILRRRERLLALAAKLPGTCAVEVGRHVALEVGRKRFGWALDDHHGDGRFALCCKAERGTNRGLAEVHPERYFVPPYVGPQGWVGLRLDLARIDWAEVEELLRGAWLLVAPAKLRKSSPPPPGT